MSLLRLASNLTKRAAGATWRASGADRVPIFRDAQNAGSSVMSRFRKEKTDTSGNMASAAVEANKEANRVARESAKLIPETQPIVTGGADFPKKVAEDISEIKQLIKKQTEGGGLLGALGSLGGMGGALGKWGPKIATTVGGALTAVAGSKFIRGAGDVLQKGKGLISSGIESAGGFLKNAKFELPKIAQRIPTTLGGAKAAGSSLLSRGISAVTGAGSAALSAAGGFIKSVPEKLSKAKDAVGGMFTAAKSTAPEAKGLSKLAGKTGLKSLIKKVPGIGLLAGIGFGAQRALSGDFTGAGMEVASGLASTIPGPGTAASIGLDAGLVARDAGLFDSKDEKAALTPVAATSSAAMVKPAGVTPTKTGVEDNLTAMRQFVNRGLNENEGVFVRLAKDALRDDGSQPSALAPATQTSPGAPSVASTVRPVSRGNEAQGITDLTGQSSAVPTFGRRPSLSLDQISETAVAKGVGPAPINPNVFSKTRGKFNGFGADVDGHITEAANKYGIDEKVLRGFVKMEGGWTGAMSPTGAIGTGQFIQSTWDGLAKTKDGQDIGMTKIGDRFRKEDDPRRDKRTNTLATGLLAKQNAEMLKKNGIEPTGENLYMMHNIGPGVIPVLKGGEASPATLTAMRQNGMKDGMTAKDFVAFQKDRFNSHYDAANNVTKEPVKDSSFALTKPEVQTSYAVKSEAEDAAKANRSAAAQAPIVIAQAPAAPAQSAPSGGPVGLSGHMGTRNDDSSIRRVTDQKTSASMP